MCCLSGVKPLYYVCPSKPYREVFNYFIEDFKTYKPLLSAIKNEYELTLGMCTVFLWTKQTYSSCDGVEVPKMIKMSLQLICNSRSKGWSLSVPRWCCWLNSVSRGFWTWGSKRELRSRLWNRSANICSKSLRAWRSTKELCRPRLNIEHILASTRHTSVPQNKTQHNSLSGYVHEVKLDPVSWLVEPEISLEISLEQIWL